MYCGQRGAPVRPAAWTDAPGVSGAAPDGAGLGGRGILRPGVPGIAATQLRPDRGIAGRQNEARSLVTATTRLGGREQVQPQRPSRPPVAPCRQPNTSCTRTGERGRVGIAVVHPAGATRSAPRPARAPRRRAGRTAATAASARRAASRGRSAAGRRDSGRSERPRAPSSASSLTSGQGSPRPRGRPRAVRRSAPGGRRPSAAGRRPSRRRPSCSAAATAAGRGSPVARWASTTAPSRSTRRARTSPSAQTTSSPIGEQGRTGLAGGRSSTATASRTCASRRSRGPVGDGDGQPGSTPASPEPAASSAPVPPAIR